MTTTYRTTDNHGHRGTVVETVRGTATGRLFYWDHLDYLGGRPSAPLFGPAAPSAPSGFGMVVIHVNGTHETVPAPSAPNHGRVVVSGTTTDGRTVTTDAAVFAAWEELARAACAPSVSRRLAAMSKGAA
jgi:hypothetical protein